MARAIKQLRGTARFSRAIAIMLLSPIAQAEPPIGIVDTPCLAPLPLPKTLVDATEAMLSPGTIDPERFKKLYEHQEVHDFMVAMDERAKQDWPNLCRYRLLNESLKMPPRVVFLGDSITENWILADPGFFSNQIIDRGISGQTTPQMLLRFFSDVIDLHPSVVHLMAGTNDVAGNTGAIREQDYRDNIEAMVELAKSRHIRVIIASIPPAAGFPWRPEIKSIDRIKSLNRWLKSYASAQHIQFADYYAALVDQDGGLKKSLSADGVHPNRDGYAQMRPLALAAINQN